MPVAYQRRAARVLLLEPDPDLGETIAFGLRERGARVRVVTTAAEALLVARRERPDIFLTELMRLFCGRSIVTAVGELAPSAQLPIVAMAETPAKKVPENIRRRTVFVLRKPFDLRALGDVVASSRRVDAGLSA